MASNYLLLLVILTIASKSTQDLQNNEVDDEETNPFVEAASSILKEQNAQNIGAMVQNFMEKDGANILGEVISNFGKQNAGQLLQGLGSMMANQNKQDKNGEEDNTPNILEGLGSLMGALQGAEGGDGAGALLQGLGSMLGGQGGEGGGLDPALIGSLVNMFAQSQSKPKTPKKSSTSPNEVEKQESRNKPDFDMGDLISLASTLFGNGQKGKGQKPDFLSFIPMIMQTINSFVGPDAEKRAESHSDHSWLLPPFLEKLHVMFDHFIHSEMGRYVIIALGAEKAFKVFTDDNGRFNYEKFGEMMENLSFRRYWIHLVADRIASFLHYASDPKVYKAYFTSAQYFANSYLKSQGFPKSTLFNPARPVETISAFVNYVAKKYFDVKIQSKQYVQPAVAYLQDLIRLSEKSGPLGSSARSKELAEKLTDTINLEIIEPLARVNRAFRFAKAAPECERYVLCLINSEDQNEPESLPGLKKLLYQGSSLLAGWSLSRQTGTSFWTLYTDITEGTKCKDLYLDKCNEFHIEEMKVTTEYFHNEL